MCRGGSHHARATAAGPTLALERTDVGEPTVTTVVDNVVDVLLPETGPARRPRRDLVRVQARTLAQGVAWSQPVAEHGFSSLVDVRLAGGRRHHVLFLSGRVFEPIIGPTVDALSELAPDVVVPAHCTGWKATHAIAARLPEAFVQNSVGTSIVLEVDDRAAKGAGT